VPVELVEPQLRERDDPDHDVVVAHRDDEHRFVHVVGAGDRRPARVVVGVRDEQRFPLLADPAREADPEPCAEQVEVDLLVCPDPPFECDRDQQVGRFDDVHAGVVVLDDPARLLDDRPADGVRAFGAAEPG